MELMLEIISRQKFLSDIKPSYIFTSVGGYIGRSDESDWILPDRTKKVSRKHVFISCEGQSFYLEDLSSNGVMSTLTRQLVGKNEPYQIVHGDSFQIGDYVLQARLLKDPAVYTSSDMTQSSELIPDDSFLDPDPLVAMEQQELYQAKQRLGIYDDLLGDANFKPQEQVFSDHNEARLDALLTISAVPDTTLAAPEPGSHVRLNQEPAPDPFALEVKKQVIETVIERSSEMDLFFTTLGLENIPDDPQERERAVILAGELLKASIDGLVQSLKNRASGKNELRLTSTTVQLTGNNPFKFSNNAAAAINNLFTNKQDGMQEATSAVYEAFDDLHSHNMGLLAGARAAMSAVLDRLSPGKIAERLDGAGTVKFKRQEKLWKTHVKLHTELTAHEGLTDFFLIDFARAYEMQCKTLQPIQKNQQGGS